MERRPLKKEAVDEDLAADFEQPPRKKIHRDFGASSSRNEQVYGNENSLEEMQVSSYSTDNNQDVEMLSHHDDDLPDDPTEDMFADNVMRMDIPIQGNKNNLGKQIMSEILSNTMLLRNSGGGVKIIRNLNYSEKDNDNLYKDSYTSKVDRKLQNMATYRGEVGEFNSWYQTVWWKGVGKWLLYYIKDGPQLTFPLESKVYTVNQHDHKEVGIEEIQRRLLQSTKKPSNYHPEVTHVHCKEKHGKLELGMKCFHLHESTNIQLKSSNASKEGGQGDNAINGMCKDIRHYSSAFSQNQEGGSIYFGITEKENPKSSNKTAFSKTPVVCGIKFDIDEEKERVIRMKIDDAMSKEMLWVRHDGEKANKDEIHQYYDVRFHNVGAENSTRKVLEVSVAKFYGCVFSYDPKPCYLDAEGQRKYYEVEEWVPIVMKDQYKAQSEDFISRFQRLDIDQKNEIYEVEKSSEKIQQSVFKTEKGLRFTPEALLNKLHSDYGDPLQQFTKKLQERFNEDNGVVIMENFASIFEEKPECLRHCPESLLSDFFVLTEKQMPVFVSVVSVEQEDSLDNLRKYNREMAKLIKLNLSKYCHSFFVTILFGVVNVHETCHKTTQEQLEEVISQKARHCQAHSLVDMNQTKLSEYLRCFTIMASVFPSPLHNRIGTSLLNIATEKQFHLMWEEIHRSRHLLVKGFPGTGKTIMARQLVLNLYNRGFEPEEILFLSQHRTSCCQIQKMERCVALTPDCLKDDLKDQDRKVMYRKIKHFIIDDAQMICAVSKDKRWFVFLHNLWKKKRSNKYSLFWVFYGDHKYCRDDGGCMKFIKNRFDHKIKLDLILRNSHSVAKNAIKYAENPKYKTAVEKITTVHNFKGEAVVCEEKLLSNVEQYLQEIGDFLNSVLSEGYHYEDVAILFSRQADIPRALDCISKEQVEKSEENLLCKTITSPGMVTLPRIGNVRICSASDNDITGHVVVDTFRRYSGLDRPVVLAINPYIGPYDVYTDSKGLDLIIATRPIAKLIMWEKKK